MKVGQSGLFEVYDDEKEMISTTQFFFWGGFFHRLDEELKDPVTKSFRTWL